jgi:hypothetical protein
MLALLFLALAVQVALHMDLTSISFLSDNEQLVKFLDSPDHSHPPDWRIKHFTQMFSNHAILRDLKIHEISRNLNITADALARQALLDLDSQNIISATHCSYESHVQQCTVLQALLSVSLNHVTLLSARCC